MNTKPTTLSAEQTAQAGENRKPIRTLTPSAVDTFVECERAYDFSYGKAVYSTAYPSSLAIGSAVHKGIEALKRKEGLEKALSSEEKVIENKVEQCLPYLSPEEAQQVKETSAKDKAKTRAMLRAYAEIFHATQNGEDKELDFVEIEVAFQRPLINPVTGRSSRTFTKAGKADGIVLYRNNPDAGLFVYELKTISDTLDEMEEAMKNSIQPPTYQELASRTLGKPIVGTIVDLIKKPVLRGNKGETLDQFESRCLEEYRKDRDRYFRRAELPYDEQRVREAMEAFWRAARAIRESDKFGYLTPRGRKCKKSFGWCQYRALCWFGTREGYRLGDYAHEELELQI